MLLREFPQRERLEDRNAQFERGALDGRCLQFVPAPRGPVRLRDDALELGALGRYAKGRNREFAGSEEKRLNYPFDSAQGAAASAISSSSRVCGKRTFFALSMYSTPLR